MWNLGRCSSRQPASVSFNLSVFVNLVTVLLLQMERGRQREKGRAVGRQWGFGSLVGSLGESSIWGYIFFLCWSKSH